MNNILTRTICILTRTDYLTCTNGNNLADFSTHVSDREAIFNLESDCSRDILITHFTTKHKMKQTPKIKNNNTTNKWQPTL